VEKGEEEKEEQGDEEEEEEEEEVGKEQEEAEENKEEKESWEIGPLYSSSVGSPVSLPEGCICLGGSAGAAAAAGVTQRRVPHPGDGNPRGLAVGLSSACPRRRSSLLGSFPPLPRGLPAAPEYGRRQGH